MTPQPTPLSVSISPTRVNLPATTPGIAPYHGEVTLTDRGTSPVTVHMSVLRLANGCPRGTVPWLHVTSQTVTLQPGQAQTVAYTVDGGARGQAAVVASAQEQGHGNLHLSGAVGTRVVAGSPATVCASAPVPARQPGLPPWALLVILAAVLALAILAVRRLRRHHA